MGAGDTSEKKTTIHSSLSLPAASVVHRGVALITSQILRMDLVDFFFPNTFQTGERKRGGDEEEGIFSPRVFQCVFV